MPSARCNPVPLSRICAPGPSGSPSRKPVVEAAPPVHCATFSYTLQSSKGPGPKPLIEATIIFGLMAWIFSHGKPMRSSTPGPKFSTSTSQLLISAVRTSLPLGFLVSSVIERLLWLSMVKYRLSTFGMSCSWPRVMSPTPGGSTLITSAPNQASSCVQVGPDWTWVKSRMRTPSSALVIVLLRILCLPPQTAGNKGLGGDFLLLLQNALRIEVADAAALRARGRVDHRVDQRRLARVHRRVDGLLQLVGRGGIHADAAEGFHHLVVARALHEHGGRRIGVGAVDIGAAIDAVIVEYDDADRKVVAADGLDLHAGEA